MLGTIVGRAGHGVRKRNDIYDQPFDCFPDEGTWHDTPGHAMYAIHPLFFYSAFPSAQET